MIPRWHGVGTSHTRNMSIVSGKNWSSNSYNRTFDIHNSESHIIYQVLLSKWTNKLLKFLRLIWCQYEHTGIAFCSIIHIRKYLFCLWLCRRANEQNKWKILWNFASTMKITQTFLLSGAHPKILPWANIM